MNFTQPLPPSFDLGFPLEHSVFLRTRTGLQNLVESNKILQIMGRITSTPNGDFWEPLWISGFKEELLEEPFCLWDADQDRKELGPKVTCGVALHLVQLDGGIWKVAYRQFLGTEIPRTALNKMLTSATDWLANEPEVLKHIDLDGSWTEISAYPALRLIFKSLRFALEEQR